MTIIFFVIISLVILAMVLIGRAADKKEEKERAEAKAEAEREAKVESIYSFEAWWLRSDFNSFIVLEKRTPMHFNGKRYMAVRNVITGECYSLEVDVTTYFNYDVGTEIHLTDISPEYITEEALKEFTEATGINLSWFDYCTIDRYRYKSLNLYNDLEEDENL